jgi:hypothetical protein
VEEDDVEKANPSTFDTVEDLAQLRFLNESSVLHTLRQRYGNNLVTTFLRLLGLDWGANPGSLDIRLFTRYSIAPHFVCTNVQLLLVF